MDFQKWLLVLCVCVRVLYMSMLGGDALLVFTKRLLLSAYQVLFCSSKQSETFSEVGVRVFVCL